MGDGCTIAGAWKGFKEFYDLGYVDDYPKMLGVQAEGASAIHDAFQGHEDIDDIADTIADSIAVGRPRNTIKAAALPKERRRRHRVGLRRGDSRGREAPREHGGDLRRASRATPVAGVQEALEQGIIERDETVVVVSTGFWPERYREREESDGRRQPNRTRTIRKWKRCSGDAQAAAADD